ncbi:MAG: imidazole glycerol phosphate synthase subunit HisF [Alphaproteobacteria bacterium]|nr:imidazole glycerol phosphate synthase subunit HisF [Alphaproteobacteria bacterium]
MTLAARIIPCLDVREGRVVKGVNFVDLKDAGDPAEQAAIYDAQGADEICFLDIAASHENRGTLLDVVRRTADKCFTPLTVGGGVRTPEDVRALLLAGADKAAINTAAVRTPDVVDACAKAFGAQCIVVAIDAKQVSPDRWEIFTHGGSRETGIDAVRFAVEAVERGAGELLVTSIDRDGTRAGYDLALLSEISSRVKAPVIASGGAGTLQHLVEAITLGGASAALAASIFHFGTFSLAQAREALRDAGAPVRDVVGYAP